MHTIDWTGKGDRNENIELHFHHNSDFSGDLLMIVPDTTVDVIASDKVVQIRIPTQALLDFAAEYVRSELIEQVEAAESNDLLTGDWGRA